MLSVLKEIIKSLYLHFDLQVKYNYNFWKIIVSSFIFTGIMSVSEDHLPTFSYTLSLFHEVYVLQNNTLALILKRTYMQQENNMKPLSTACLQSLIYHSKKIKPEILTI